MTTSPELIAYGALTIGEIVDLKKWGAKGSVFMHLAHRQMLDGEPWVEVSYRTVAAAIGRDDRYVASLLKQLVEDRVLEHEPGRGRRAARYRVNPDVDRWRNVRLRVHHEIAMWRLDGAGFGRAKYLSRIGFPTPRASAGGQRATVSSAEIYDADHRRFVAAVLAASQEASLGNVFREFVGEMRAGFAALGGGDRGATEPVEREHGAASIATDAADARRSTEVASLSLVPAQREIDAAHRSALLTAIARATNGGTVWGAGAARAEQLLRCVDAEQLVAWCDEEAARRRDRPLVALALLAILEARANGASDAQVRAVPKELVANLRRLVLTMLEHDDLDLAAERLAELREVDASAAEDLVVDHPELVGLLPAT